MTELPATPRSALAVMAHPDDIEFMAGGLVSRWAREGVELHYCLLTDGNSGSRDPNLTPEQLVRMRHNEQRAAGEMLGVKSFHFMGYMDGRLEHTVALRLQIARLIRQVRPEAVITCDPQFFYGPRYINHADHRAAGEATCAAIMPLANTRLAALELLEEGLEPHDVRHVYLAIPARATLWVPLEEADIEQKIAIVGAHTSQVGNWPYAEMVRNFATEAAQEAREQGIACEYAERYSYVRLGRDD